MKAFWQHTSTLQKVASLIVWLLKQTHKCWSAGRTVSNATMLRGKVIKLSKCWNISGEADNLYSSTEPCEEFLNLIKMYNRLLMWLQKMMICLQSKNLYCLCHLCNIDLWNILSHGANIGHVYFGIKKENHVNMIWLSYQTALQCTETEI